MANLILHIDVKTQNQNVSKLRTIHKERERDGGWQSERERERMINSPSEGGKKKVMHLKMGQLIALLISMTGKH